jgi:hypothetical protein
VRKIPFDEKELRPVAQAPGMPGEPPMPVYDFPVSMKQACRAAYDNEPIWLPIGVETNFFSPRIIPDNIARGFLAEESEMPEAEPGGRDMFGVEWVYQPQARGSMVKPGSPVLKDANDWVNAIRFPDIDKWDWEGSAKANEKYLGGGKFNVMWLLNGCWFERLVSFMDFEGAAVALIDEDQRDAVRELFDRTTDLYCAIIDRSVRYFDIDAFMVHDDWGSQRSPFFSPETGRELFLPYMEKLVGHIHSKGKIAELHSCGQIEAHFPTFVEAGWDSWSGMSVNDTHMLYDKYGDKIHIGVYPDLIDANAPEEEQRRAARDFVDRFAKPDKLAFINPYVFPMMTPAYREEIYRYSRIKFSRQAI